MIQNDGPNEVFYHDNGVVKAEKWFGSDGLHRPINLGPAVIEYDENGRKIAERWYQNGKLYNK
jgi:antitoxin component YwqK of YwqJK toxin-antitoxin module